MHLQLAWAPKSLKTNLTFVCLLCFCFGDILRIVFRFRAIHCTFLNLGLTVQLLVPYKLVKTLESPLTNHAFKHLFFNMPMDMVFQATLSWQVFITDVTLVDRVDMVAWVTFICCGI
jgi:hypothetical protein